MHVLISGASGLVGTALAKSLRARGDRVRVLVRRAPRDGDEARWDPASGTIDAGALEGIDAVVHLAGEGVAARRWNAAHKRAVLESRETGTRTIAEAIARAATKPRVLVSASAVGFYGDTGALRVTEASPAGEGFLVDVCKVWEAATKPAEDVGVRVVHARLGIVMAREGGAFEKMVLPFKLGLGGRVGDGTQGFSWVALDDVVGGIVWCLDHAALRGPVNLVSPNPVSNEAFTRALGRALHRPTVIPVPAFALKLAAGGEMAHEMFLGGSFVVPEKLAGAGYRFAYERVEDVIGAMLKA